jgi:hypothetical protein
VEEKMKKQFALSFVCLIIALVLVFSGCTNPGAALVFNKIENAKSITVESSFVIHATMVSADGEEDTVDMEMTFLAMSAENAAYYKITAFGFEEEFYISLEEDTYYTYGKPDDNWVKEATDVEEVEEYAEMLEQFATLFDLDLKKEGGKYVLSEEVELPEGAFSQIVKSIIPGELDLNVKLTVKELTIEDADGVISLNGKLVFEITSDEEDGSVTMELTLDVKYSDINSTEVTLPEIDEEG